MKTFIHTHAYTNVHLHLYNGEREIRPRKKGGLWMVRAMASSDE